MCHIEPVASARLAAFTERPIDNDVKVIVESSQKAVGRRPGGPHNEVEVRQCVVGACSGGAEIGRPRDPVRRSQGRLNPRKDINPLQQTR